MLRRHAILLAAVILSSLASLAIGGVGAAATFFVMLPVIAWRYDNRAGTFLLLAILFDIVLLVMVLLVALMSMHR